MRHIEKTYSTRTLVHAVVSAVLYYTFFIPSNSAVFAGPEGAEVIHGRVSFQQNGLNTVITASDKSIVNYKSFNISRPEAVQFVQPHSNASVLNRINSANPTNINGTLTANGRVFFVNPAGVYIGNGAKINVNQLVASGLNIANSDFLNGKYHFSGGQGSVENRGDITAEKVHLIGKQVANYGTINCPGGYVVMAAGDRVFLGTPGSDLTVEVDTEPLTEPKDLDIGVRNDGTINAGGGEIFLAAAGDIYSQAISNVGTLSASVRNGDAGNVKLIANEGNISNRGSIKTTSKSGRGGKVTTEGNEVTNSGTVDVTGSEGGQVTMKGKRVGQFGTIHADGANSHGGNVTLSADEVVALDSESLTTANAGLNGNGGDVTVFSDDSALFWPDAKIEAKGGSESGDGGFVEVSGKEHVEIYGLADVGANDGDEGTFFIDPHNVTIQNNPGSLDDQGNPFEAGSDGDTVSDDAIESVTNAGGAAVIQTSSGGLGDGDIIQDADATIDFTGAGGDASLTLNAADDVELNGGITVSGAAITVTINANSAYDTASGEGDVDINADISTNGGSFTSSGIDFDNTGGEIHTNGGNVNLDGHSGAINIGANIVAGTGDISATSGTSVVVRSQASGITAGNVDIVTVGRFACEPGSRITAGGDGTDLNINAGHIDLNADGVGNETLTNSGNGTITLAASGDIFLSNNSINVDEGAVDIDSANIITAEGTDEGTDEGTESEIKANGLVSLTAGAIGDEQNPLELDGSTALEITATGMDDDFIGGEIRIKENTSTITSTTIIVDDPLRDGIYIDYAEVNGNDDTVDIGFDHPSHYIFQIDLDNDSESSFSYTGGTGHIHLRNNNSELDPINMGDNGDVTLSTPYRIDFHDWQGFGTTPITTAGGSVNLTASEIIRYNPDRSSAAPLGIQGASALTLTDTGPGPMWLEEVGDSTIGSTSITVGDVGYGTIDIIYNDEGSRLDIGDNHFINEAFLPSSFSYMAGNGDITLGAGELPINIGNNGDVTLITSDNIVFPDWWGQEPLIIMDGGSVNLTADGIYSYTDDLAFPLVIEGAKALNLTDTGPGHMWLTEVGGSTIGSTSITVGDIGYGTILMTYAGEMKHVQIGDNHFIYSAFPPSSFSYTATEGDIQIGSIDAGTADVTLEARAGAIRDAVDDIKLFNTAYIDVIGGTIDLTAQAGGIGTPVLIEDEGIGFENRVLEVKASQELNADTTADGGDILISSLGDLPVGLITADDGAGTIGDITLNSTGSINDASDDTDVDISGDTVTLTAADEIRGGSGFTSDNAVEISSSELDISTTGTAADAAAIEVADIGGTYLKDIDTAASDIAITSDGDLMVGHIHAGTATAKAVIINADGSIDDTSTDTNTDIIAGTVDLDAATSIGATRALETSASSISADTTNGNIDIDNSHVSDVTATSLTTGTGEILFSQSGGALAVTKATTTYGSIEIDSDNSLTAHTVTAGGANKDVTLATTSGNVLVNNVMAVDDQIKIKSAGAVVEFGSDAEADITTGILDIDSVSGVGSAEALETQVGFIDIDNSTSGNIQIDEVASGGALGVNNVKQDGTGTVVIRTLDGTLTVVNSQGGVSAMSGETILDAQDAGTSDDDDLVVNETVTSTSGKIYLHAADDVIFGATGDVSSTSGEIVVAATDAITMEDGTIIDAGSGKITLSADGDIALGRLVTTNDTDSAVAITTTSGAVTDTGDTDIEDIVAKSIEALVKINAKAGIGTTENAIETNVTNLDVHSGGGDIVIIETDDVELQNILADTGNIRFEATNGAMAEGAIKAGGGSLTMKQAGALNLKDFKFEEQEQSDTNLTLESFNGSITVVDTANSGKDENAADQWKSITAKAQNGIILEGNDNDRDIIIEALHSVNGNISVNSENSNIKANDEIKADTGNISLTANNGQITTKNSVAKTGIELKASGDVTAYELTTTTGNISVHSKEGNLIVNGAVNADNGGVELIADAGKIYTEHSSDDTLNVDVIGFSDGTKGIELPRGDDKAAIVILSKKDLILGEDATLTASGTYNPSIYDDRDSIRFKSAGENAGESIDVAIYVGSYDFESDTGGDVTVNSAVSVETNGTMVIDAENRVNAFGNNFIESWKDNNGSNKLQVVSRITETLEQAVDLGTLPYVGEVFHGHLPSWLRDLDYILRGGRVARVLRSVAVPPLDALDEDKNKDLWREGVRDGKIEPAEIEVLRGAERLKPEQKLPLESGDTITTNNRTTAFVEFPDGSEIVMLPDTRIKVENQGARILFGEIIASISGEFQVTTEHISISVEGSNLVVQASKDGEVIVKTVVGRIDIRSNRKHWSPISMGTVSIKPNGQPQQARIWKEERPQITQQPPQEFRYILRSIVKILLYRGEIPVVTGKPLLFKYGQI
jgi:filamentous hemagglutinin family protein